MITRKYSYLAMMAVASLFWQCAENSAKTNSKMPAKTETMTIQHYQVPCQGESIQLCYLVKKQGQEDWEYFYDEIEGLDYEWGYVYSLEVSQTEVKNPPQDGSSLHTKVEKVVKKEAVAADTRFELPLTIDGNPILAQNSGNWSYFQTIPVSVSPELTTAVAKANTGVFRHGDKKQTLTLLSVK